MASTTSNKKLSQPWHTKSFHLTRFWMVTSIACYICAESILEGKFPATAGFAVPFAFFELLTIASWNSGEPTMQPLLTDGLIESHKRFKKLLYCIGGMIGSFGIALYIVYRVVSDHQIHSLLFIIILLGINLIGYFLQTWLREAFAIVQQYWMGAVPITPEVHEFSSPASLPPSQPVPQTHSQRLLAGSGIRP